MPLVFIAGFISGVFDDRRHQKFLKTDYERNHPKYNIAFAGEPANIDPSNIKDDQLFSMYDRVTADHIGDITASDLRFLISCFDKWGHEWNDFFVMPETVAVLQAEGITSSVAELLEAALAKHKNSIEVRWAKKENS
jgi:hypothetical protein